MGTFGKNNKRHWKNNITRISDGRTGFNKTSRIMAKSQILFPPVPIFNNVKSDAPEARVVYFHVNQL